MIEDESERLQDEIREAFGDALARARGIVNDPEADPAELKAAFTLIQRSLGYSMPSQRAVSVETRQHEGPLILGGHLVGAGAEPSRPAATEEQLERVLATVSARPSPASAPSEE